MIKRWHYYNVRTVQVLILFLDFSHCWRSFNIKYFDPIFTNLAPEILEFNCTIDQNGRITSYLNVKRDLTNVFDHMAVVFDGDGVGKQNLVYGNKTVNVCKFLTNRKESVMLTYLFKIGNNFGELPKRCPLKKKMYYVINMQIVPDNLPSFMPIGNGTFTFAMMTKLPGAKEMKTCTKGSVRFKFENAFKRGGEKTMLN